MAVTVNSVYNGDHVVWQNYTPVWSGGGTPPAIVDGTLTGRYCQFGKLVTAQITLTAGANSTYGNSSWSFTLPVNAATTNKATGSCIITNTGVAWYAGSCRIESATTLSPYYGTNGNTVTSSHPYAFGDTDVLEIQITYEAA